jgi:murein DD-endopeptidase MepM/ murein hydrolase activator NlpD
MLSLLLHFSLFLVLFSSCSSMKSGSYVFIETPSHMQRVAKTYGITLDQLKQANPDKNFQGKEWIFIPNKVGIVYLLNETYVIEDYGNLGTGRFLWPVPNFYKVSSHFGKRGKRHHDGIDIPATSGSPILAVDRGVVMYSNNGIRGYGNMIVLDHGGDVFTVYAHNKKNLVRKGDKVSKGSVIAHIGNTGRSTGPHLHFEIRVKDKVRNPAQYLSRLAND